MSNVKHGMYGTRIYIIWSDMKRRCLNSKDQNYHYYGGRGITACNEWLEFIPFYKWALSNNYRDDLTIDRLNNDGNYEPTNCRWITQKQQNNNKRTNILLTIDGIEASLATHCERLGLRYRTIKNRISTLEWDVDKAFKMPIKKRTVKNYSQKLLKEGI